MQNELQKDGESTYIKLDYTLQSIDQDPHVQDRLALVNEIIEKTPSEKLTKKYLERLADYLVVPKKTKRGQKVLTENRKKVIYERETSLEGLALAFNNNNENSNNAGEDGIYNLMIDNKQLYLTPKLNSITDEEIDNIPGMREITETIEQLQEAFKKAKDGKQRKSLKANIIELYKDRYILRASHKGRINCVNPAKAIYKIDLYEDVTIDEDGELDVDANLSLLIPSHVSYILCSYSKLKEECYSKFDSDMYYMLLALEEITEEALAKEPLYMDLLIYKIDGMQNLDIQRELELKYGFRYSVEHISSLWRNKIPKLIAEQARTNWLIYHYTEEEKGAWKKCSRCGQIKLAHNKFFSKNRTSKDGFYSICKECRNKKK